MKFFVKCGTIEKNFTKKGESSLEKYFIGEMTMHYQKEIAPESIVDLYYGQEDDHFKIEFKIAEQIHFVISGRFKEKKE